MKTRPHKLVRETFENPISQMVFCGLMWGVFAVLWVPLGMAVLSAMGFNMAAQPESSAQSSEALNDTARVFLVCVAGLLVALLGWAKYNQIRFAGRHRRQANDAPTEQQVSEFFDIDVDDLGSFKQQKIITLHFDDNVMRTDLETSMIDALETETDSYMVADLQVSALVVQVRPGGEKRYFCRLSDYDWRPLPNTDELTLDEARDRVREMMNARFAGATDAIKEERELTLAQFIDRHYRSAESSILHTDEFQADNESLSQLDENISSHSEIFTFLMDMKLTAIQADDVRAWQRAQSERSVSRSEIVYRTEQLRRIYTRAVKWGVVFESPLSAIDISVWLTPEQPLTDVA